MKERNYGISYSSRFIEFVCYLYLLKKWSYSIRNIIRSIEEIKIVNKVIRRVIQTERVKGWMVNILMALK